MKLSFKDGRQGKYIYMLTTYIPLPSMIRFGFPKNGIK